MAGAGAAKTSLTVIGGFLCLGLVMLAIAAAIVLSLIPVYTADHSEEGYGEEYTMDAVMLKMLYENTSNTFSDSAVGNNADLSTACASQAQSDGASDVYGCVVDSTTAWSGGNSSTDSRRRRATTAGLYCVSRVRLFFKSRCPKIADVNKTQTSSSVSSCVKSRLGYCNKLANNDNTARGFKKWTINSFVLSILDAVLNEYASISPSAVYGIPYTIASSISVSLKISSGVQSSISQGCRYAGILSISSIDAIISGQSYETTTESLSTIVAG